MDSALFTPIWVSVKTALLATVITFFLGIYAAVYVIRAKHYQGFWDGLFTLLLQTVIIINGSRQSLSR